MYTALNVYRVRCLIYVHGKMNLHYALQTYILTFEIKICLFCWLLGMVHVNPLNHRTFSEQAHNGDSGRRCMIPPYNQYWYQTIPI